jgi:hypothetical protein
LVKCRPLCSSIISSSRFLANCLAATAIHQFVAIYSVLIGCIRSTK